MCATAFVSYHFTFHKMEFPDVMTREFLQGRRESFRRQKHDEIVTTWTSELLQKARRGETEWSFNVGKMIENLKLSSRSFSSFSTASNPFPHFAPTVGELLDAVKRRFPDCEVSLADTWVDVHPGTKEMQTRLTISWA